MDIQQARNSSASFYLAFQRCMEQRPLPGGQIQFLIAPAIVSVAFSIEVGFKVLILRSGGAPSGHELKRLFASLEANTQQVIRAKVGIADAEFDSSLNVANKAFVEWRYVYEQASAHASLQFLGSLAKATQDALGP